MSFFIRKAVVEDAQAVGLVHEQAWRETYSRMLPPYVLAARSAEKSAAMFRRGGCRNMFVAESEEGIAGFCGFGHSRDAGVPAGTGEIYGLYVLKRRQRRGMGTALMAEALSALAAQGFSAVFLWVLEKNRKARRFYEKNGFSLSGEVRNFPGEPIREIRYVRPLDAGVLSGAAQTRAFPCGQKEQRREKASGANMAVSVRQERPEDHEAVHALVREAFAEAQHRDGTEQDLVDALRKGRSFVPGLSLVAEVCGCLAGHILFSRAMVGSAEVLVLAPLAVLPRFRRQGVGSALVREGLARARALGFCGVLVLGSARYYSRFGFRPASGFGVEVPEGLPEPCFLALPLGEGAVFPAGRVAFAEEFGL
ncbi:GNAT family N-acetyltransferase [Mailhella massiliensis]|uniref:GNAT family N-acetyltransferase n=1 Tax=Mailhella massiliensis TaxID=1903261 RepID=A0A921AXV9_9BACT|nr:GNAT family N-acetyltransferase [Mailhella massiliensis]HJD97900.1 GNAT family N-acetyltransferase [Mailhella massiliensis]